MTNILSMRTSNRLLKFFKFSGLQKLYHLLKPLFSLSIQAKIHVGLKNEFTPLATREVIEPKYLSAWKYLIESGSIAGDYLEFGVSYGTSLNCMHQVLEQLNFKHVRIFGFDSFEGMPPSAAVEDGGRWHPGQFASSYDKTRKFLFNQGVDFSRTFLIKGWYYLTLNKRTRMKNSMTKASVILIDCNIYSSSKLALNFCVDLIIDEAIIVFDDWRDDKSFGDCKAYSEFLRENPNFLSKEFGTYKPTGKMFLVRNEQFFSEKPITGGVDRE